MSTYQRRYVTSFSNNHLHSFAMSTAGFHDYTCTMSIDVRQSNWFILFWEFAPVTTNLPNSNLAMGSSSPYQDQQLFHQTCANTGTNGSTDNISKHRNPWYNLPETKHNPPKIGRPKRKVHLPTSSNHWFSQTLGSLTSTCMMGIVQEIYNHVTWGFPNRLKKKQVIDYQGWIMII